MVFYFCFTERSLQVQMINVFIHVDGPYSCTIKTYLFMNAPFPKKQQGKRRYYDFFQ